MPGKRKTKRVMRVKRILTKLRYQTFRLATMLTWSEKRISVLSKDSTIAASINNDIKHARWEIHDLKETLMNMWVISSRSERALLLQEFAEDEIDPKALSPRALRRERDVESGFSGKVEGFLNKRNIQRRSAAPSHPLIDSSSSDSEDDDSTYRPPTEEEEEEEEVEELEEAEKRGKEVINEEEMMVLRPRFFVDYRKMNSEMGGHKSESSDSDFSP